MKSTEQAKKVASWSIEFSETAHKEFEKLGKPACRLITKYISERLIGPQDPRRFGKALTGNLKGFWRYRVGDYRLVCDIRDEEILILVLRVSHRKDVY